MKLPDVCACVNEENELEHSQVYVVSKQLNSIQNTLSQIKMRVN